MHLAIITHNIISGDGQGRVNVALTQYLLDQGINVTLIANQIDDDLCKQGADVISIDTGRFGEAVDLVKVWRFKRKADRLLRRIGDRFDATIACGVTLSVPHTLNAVHFAHGGWRRSPYHAAKVNPGLNGAYQWLFSTLNDHWERKTLAQAEHIVAVSEMVRRELIDSGLPPDKIEVIVNGVDVNEFKPGPADRESFDLPQDVPLGLFVGDLQSPIKNPDGVLHALADVPEAHVAFAGALERSSLPALAEKLGVADRVHFLGFFDDIPALMRATDFFVLPSRRDSCPLVLLEAMASGLPVIITKMVGTANLVTDQCGFVLDRPDDHETLARSMSELASKPDLRHAMGRAARSVAQQHSWERMAAQYLQILQQEISPELYPAE